MHDYSDPGVRSATQSQLSQMPTREVLRVLRGGPRGQRLAEELEAVASAKVKQVADDQRRARRRGLLLSYVPWFALGVLVTLLLATQLSVVRNWAQDQGLPWWEPDPVGRVLVREISTDGFIIQRPPGQDTTRLIMMDPPEVITLNGEPISLGATEGWVSLNVGLVDDVNLTLGGEARHYRWTTAGWQRITD